MFLFCVFFFLQNKTKYSNFLNTKQTFIQLAYMPVVILYYQPYWLIDRSTGFILIKINKAADTYLKIKTSYSSAKICVYSIKKHECQTRKVSYWMLRCILQLVQG